MNAKELIAVAEKIVADWRTPSTQTPSELLASHVLATVKTDDDDQITPDWLEALTGTERESSDTLVSVNVTDELSLVGDIGCFDRWQVWFNEYEIGECVDKAGFRSLCRGLSVALVCRTLRTALGTSLQLGPMKPDVRYSHHNSRRTP